MPANRSRTLRWRQCLQQIHERNGAIEIAVARSYSGNEDGSHLVWRVRVLDLTDTEIVVEQPATLGQVINLKQGVALVAILSVGQNRWMFNTTNLGNISVGLNASRSSPALRLLMPASVQRCQRRSYYRVKTSAISLPEIDMWPLFDPKSVVLAERANEIQCERDRRGEMDEDVVADPLEDDEIKPELGPRFKAQLMNIGGGGIGVQVAPEHGQMLARHRLFWLRFSLPPELRTPICATAKLAHSHMQADQHLYAGLAFDFTFNTEHQAFVVEQICRYIAVQQRVQLRRQMSDRQERKSA